MKNWECQMKTSDVNYINTLQDMEERLSGVGDKKKWVKESVKSKFKKTQNFQEIWDTLTSPNLQIVEIRVDEGEETQVKHTEGQRQRKCLKKIIKEKLPNIKKPMSIKVQEA